ncbi:MAG TPA: hypothetical protein PK339_11245 [Flavitalea sp.]|nr:hypothetical protein [Flavitalea sp.]
MKNAFLVALGLIVFLVACSKKKEDPEPPPPPTATDLLTSANVWKIDTIALDTDKNGEIDTPIPGGFRACDLDNTISFAKEKTGIFDFGALKCDDSETQPIAFGWSLKNDDKVLNIDGELPGGLTGDVDILELKEKSFIFSRPAPGQPSANIIVKLEK